MEVWVDVLCPNGSTYPYTLPILSFRINFYGIDKFLLYSVLLGDRFFNLLTFRRTEYNDCTKCETNRHCRLLVTIRRFQWFTEMTHVRGVHLTYTVPEGGGDKGAEGGWHFANDRCSHWITRMTFYLITGFR